MLGPVREPFSLPQGRLMSPAPSPFHRTKTIRWGIWHVSRATEARPGSQRKWAMNNRDKTLLRTGGSEELVYGAL